jgi:hypothetical protein
LAKRKAINKNILIVVSGKYLPKAGRHLSNIPLQN